MPGKNARRSTDENSLHGGKQRKPAIWTLLIAFLVLVAVVAWTVLSMDYRESLSVREVGLVAFLVVVPIFILLYVKTHWNRLKANSAGNRKRNHLLTVATVLEVIALLILVLL